MPEIPKNTRDFQSLVNVVESLRGPGGCPWDLEQTHLSLSPYAIEECYELVAAIENDDVDNMQEELGDVLLQVVLHSVIAAQSGTFELLDVIQGITEKMIRRHPHVFGSHQAKSAQEAIDSFNAVKESEKLQPKGLTEGVPLQLPALMRCQKMGKRTRKHNFDWDSPEQVLDKVDEELAEVKQAVAQGNKKEMSHEIGDLLFSVVQLARHLDLDAEQTLREANLRFEGRFSRLQALANDRGIDMQQASTDQLESLWQDVKAQSSSLKP